MRKGDDDDDDVFLTREKSSYIMDKEGWLIFSDVADNYGCFPSSYLF